MALLSRLCSPGGFPSCQVWCAELQMGPKGVAEPHCLNQCPAHPSTPPHPPPAPDCLPALQEKAHDAETGLSCHLCPSCWQGLTTKGRGDELPPFLCTLSAGTDVGDREAAKTHPGASPPPPALLTGCLPSASSQLGLREELHHPHPHLTQPFLFLQRQEACLSLAL